MFPSDLLPAYGLPPDRTVAHPIKTGLINATWRLDVPDGRQFILQRINTQIFRQPEAVAANIRAVATHLRTHWPDYLFPAPLPTAAGTDLYRAADGAYYRL